MRIFRRVVMPVAWLAVFAVIAVALAKMAFVDGMKPEQALAGPAADVAVPVIQATRATVTNKVQVKATVQSDAPVGVRNTAAGVVTHIYLAPGTKVASGDRLYQVRAEVAAGPAARVASGTTAVTGQPGAVGTPELRTAASPHLCVCRRAGSGVGCSGDPGRPDGPAAERGRRRRNGQPRDLHGQWFRRRRTTVPAVGQTRFRTDFRCGRPGSLCVCFRGVDQRCRRLRQCHRRSFRRREPSGPLRREPRAGRRDPRARRTPHRNTQLRRPA
jgi:hypothetical protein